MSERKPFQEKLELLMTGNRSLVFTADNHSPTMLKFLVESWKKELYCDLIVDVEGEKFMTHRFALAIISEYSNGTFNYQNTLDGNEIKIDVTDAGTFKDLLRYAYTGELDQLSEKK